MSEHVETCPVPLLIPDWPAPARVGACMSTRIGGVSPFPWDSLNLGDHVGDEIGRVAENRRRFEASLPAVPRYLRQVHGVAMADLDQISTPALEADAAISAKADTVCIVGVADCLPVLFTNRLGTVVAAAHAGWRGLSAGVLEATLAGLCQRAQCSPQDVMAWLGPCIGPEAFEVGPEVCAGFDRPGEHLLLRPGPAATDGSPRWLANLAGLARMRLKQAGIVQLHGNDGELEWCTFTQSGRYFSHRRATRQGLQSTGRMAAAIWIKSSATPMDKPQDS